QGIGNIKTGVDIVQWQIAANNGSQCGYCTPGFVMNMFTRMQEEVKPTSREVEDLFDGNICRCTGYRPILEGFKQLTDDYQPVMLEPAIEIDPNYCPQKTQPELLKVEVPPCFVDTMKSPQALCFKGEDENSDCYYRPVTIKQVFALLAAHGPVGPNLQLLCGNTAVGIYPKRAVYAQAVQNPRVLVDISMISSLQSVDIGSDKLTVGGQISISLFLQVLTDAIEQLAGQNKTAGLQALNEHLSQVANQQVRSVGSLAGNIFIGTNRGFLSDLVLVLATLNATVSVITREGTTDYPILELPTAQNWPTTALYGTITIPYTNQHQTIKTFKIRSRHEDSHAIVNAGFIVTLDECNKVQDSRFIVNGINADYKAGLTFTPVILKKVSAVLQNRSWDQQTLALALQVVNDEVAKYDPVNLPPGKPWQIGQIPFSYRQALAVNLFYKFYVFVCQKNNIGVPGNISSLNQLMYDVPYDGQQRYNSYPDELPVSAPIVKLAAFMQATGEAIYPSNTVAPPRTVHGAFVYSLVARGKFHYVLPGAEVGHRVELDAVIEHLRCRDDEFIDVVTYRDIKAENRVNNWTGIGLDEPLFVPCEGDEIPDSITTAAQSDKSSNFFFPTELTCVGAPIALVIATTSTKADEIADYLRQHCLHFSAKPYMGFAEAIEKKHFFPQRPATNPRLFHVKHMQQPTNDEALIEQLEAQADKATSDKSANIIAGAHCTGYQNHFYMETMSALVIPGENKAIQVHVTTQNLPGDQMTVADILGISATDVRVVLMREGGGFGGRQTRSPFMSAPAAIAAAKLNRPVRLTLSRETNFVMCGNRHPFYGNYAAKVDSDNIINAMVINYVSDGGNTYDESFPVMDLAVMSADNVYHIKNFKVTGEVAQTNLISSTAFRSFGLVQGLNILEECIERLAFEQGVAPETLREKNFYKDGLVEWSSFEVRDLTLAALHLYGFAKETCKALAPLMGQCYPDEASFDKAICCAADQDPVLAVFIGTGNIDALITLKNFSTNSYQFTPYLTGLAYNNIGRLWRDLKKTSDFDQRKIDVETFNKENKWRKRGISMIPLKYGVSYSGPRGTLNQGGAYVMAYAADASVLVHHGGVEMGQGIQTKMAQIAAQTLGINIEYIKMADTDTSVISDASPTAASTGSDLNGGAVQQACLALRQRLEKMCEDLEEYSLSFAESDKLPTDQRDILAIKTIVRNWRPRWAEIWPTIVEYAYASRVNLSESARYKTPHYSVFDDEHPAGQPFFYFTYSAAVSEVEVDILTGDFVTRRSDILFDLGRSLNPLIDVGQIEGAFVQGLGYLTSEELLRQGPDQAPVEGIPSGAITSVNTWDYKPPAGK
ncbi:MAG: molybdopterin-dependent oxidoreductase, partial [Algicola sp.]|nr:molybdopterin-dependent oxidoreductase [Algicola sp.]